MDLMVRFHSKIRIDENGCWVWCAGKNSAGYGEFRGPGKQWRAHRYSYVLHRGEIPEGLVLHHDCRNKACVNPAHLIPVTPWQNVMLDDTPARRNATAAHCRSGHKLDRMDARTGKRYCTTCKRERKRKFDAARRTGFCKIRHNMTVNFGTDSRGQRYCMQCKAHACAVMKAARAAKAASKQDTL